MTELPPLIDPLTYNRTLQAQIREQRDQFDLGDRSGLTYSDDAPPIAKAKTIDTEAGKGREADGCMGRVTTRVRPIYELSGNLPPYESIQPGFDPQQAAAAAWEYQQLLEEPRERPAQYPRHVEESPQPIERERAVGEQN